jgi:predicted aspartyl protease
MPIGDFPFLKASDADPTARPWLFVRIQNPTTGAFIHTIGLVDTGADECCLPAAFASLLAHKLTAGTPKTMNTGNGITTAYGHTCTIDIFDTRLLLSGKEQVAYTIPQAIIDFMPNLHCVLLGVRTLLSHFELTIDYPRQLFSIRKPA